MHRKNRVLCLTCLLLWLVTVSGIALAHQAKRELVEKIDALLTEATKSPDIEWLINQVRQLPAEAPEGEPIYFELGMRRAKEAIHLEVKRLEKENLGAELERLKTETAKTIARLRRELEK